ncbi:class I SAM-dependent RNA methyltransferase [Niveibacterium umoris]|uniref:Putative N6-adenine-specific DNA methylase n=1 Tax=Niveibacterium umoris TaxID=1193620 RepID=A0A840BTB8_9RHOO|nr:THUMP domain-containing protein [Niveibacterium umoris]MBB4014056.1 putative N6-adenine-specific DNA methylase [Niveibacterium umoris]
MSETFFSPCPRGLEPLLADELTALGAQYVKPVHGGVSFAGDWALCWRVNLDSRIATRVMWRVAERGYRSEDDVYALAREQAWEKYFAVERTLRIYVTAIRSPLRSLNFVTLRVKDAICDRFRDLRGQRPSIDTEAPDVRVYAFLTAETCTLYLDTSGEALTRRGFKRAKHEAPLKENLAAGILHLTGWQPDQALLDPMCGSGTFLIEAGLMALDIPPGAERSFGFEKLASYDPVAWKRQRTLALQRRRPASDVRLYGADIDMRAVDAARYNLREAGLDDLAQFRTSDILQLEAPEDHGVLLCNPPYGVRLTAPRAAAGRRSAPPGGYRDEPAPEADGAESELAAWYPKLGDHLKQAFAGWRCHFFSGDPALPKKIGLKASRRTPLMNGDIECRLFAYEVVAGSNRRPRGASAEHEAED